MILTKIIIPARLDPNYALENLLRLESTSKSGVSLHFLVSQNSKNNDGLLQIPYMT